MKPILILPPEHMSKDDIEQLRENGICVVEAKDPSAIRFTEPPITGNHDQIVEASLNLSRYLANNRGGTYTGDGLCAYWATLLINATPIRKVEVERTALVTKTKPKR